MSKKKLHSCYSILSNRAPPISSNVEFYGRFILLHGQTLSNSTIELGRKKVFRVSRQFINRKQIWDIEQICLTIYNKNIQIEILTNRM